MFHDTVLCLRGIKTVGILLLHVGYQGTGFLKISKFRPCPLGSLIDLWKETDK